MSPSSYAAATLAYHATSFSLTITSWRLQADRIGDSASNLDLALYDSGKPCGESVLITCKSAYVSVRMRRWRKLTDPILMKNPKVAAEEPIYVARVAIDPLGPGPALCS